MAGQCALRWGAQPSTVIPSMPGAPRVASDLAERTQEILPLQHPLHQGCPSHRSVFSSCPNRGFIPRIRQGQQELPAGCSTVIRHDGDFSLPSIPSRGTVRAFIPRRCGSAYPLPRLSALGCLTSLACLGPTMPSADFSRPVSVGCPTPSPSADDREISQGKTQLRSARRRRIYKAHPVADGGLRGHVPARPGCTTPHIRFLFVAPRVLDWASFRPHLAVTPLPFSLPSAPR